MISPLVCAILLMSIIGCTTSGDTVGDARDALRRGEYERAVVLFAAARRTGKLDHLTTEEADLALRRAVDGRLDRARAAEYQGDFSGALGELRAADAFAPRDERIERERQRIAREKDRVLEDLARARRLLAGGHAREAHGILEPLGGKGRVAADYDSLFRQSELAAEQQVAADRATEYRSRIQATIAAAEEAWQRGAHGAALATIDRGRREFGDDPALTARAQPWRDAVLKHFLARADVEKSAGRPAAALLLARAALAADPGNHDARVTVEKCVLSTRPALTQRVRVAEFSDETGGRVDSLRFQRNLIAALEHPFTEFTALSGGNQLSIYGTIKALEVTSPSPRTENRVHDYVVRTEQEINPEHERARRRQEEAQQRLSDRESTYEPVKRELYELERLEGRAIISASGSRRFGPYNEAAYYRLLAGGRSREARARRSVRAAEEEAETAARNLSAVPYYLDRKIIGRVPYSVRTFTRSAVATAFYAVSTAGQETSTQSRSGTETVRVSVFDSTHEGLPSAGLAPDPLEIPDDVELGEMVVDDLVIKLARRIETGIDQKRLTLLEEGRSLMRSGDEAGALDRYAAFLLTTSEVLVLERATAARAIQKSFGIEVTADGVGLGGLRLKREGTD